MTIEQATESDSGREAAFESLKETVREWRNAGRLTMTAGVTSALLKSGSLDTVTLGYSTTKEFWDAAERAEVIRRERLPNGHWFALLPGETLGSIPQLSRTPSPRFASAPPADRLRNDVWVALVEWDDGYQRYWDRVHTRAFMVPMDGGWVPSQIDTQRFAQLESITVEKQTEWMTSFAADQPEEVRSALEAALRDDAPRGAFRRCLEAVGLASGWRATLSERVTDHAQEWAVAKGVDPLTIMIRTHRDTARRNTPSSQPIRRALVPDPDARETGEPTAVMKNERLRAAVHRAVESMSIDELASLPIRAFHLLDV